MKNVEREGIYIAILRKYRHLVRTIKQAPFEQITLSWILPVMGKRDQGYQNYHTKKNITYLLSITSLLGIYVEMNLIIYA